MLMFHTSSMATHMLGWASSTQMFHYTQVAQLSNITWHLKCEVEVNGGCQTHHAGSLLTFSVCVRENSCVDGCCQDKHSSCKCHVSCWTTVGHYFRISAILTHILCSCEMNILCIFKCFYLIYAFRTFRDTAIVNVTGEADKVIIGFSKSKFFQYRHMAHLWVLL